MGKESDLIKAVKSNDLDKVEKLYIPGSKKKSRVPAPPLSHDLERIRHRVKLEHIDVNCQEDNSGYTPLILAVLNGNRDIASSLIQHGADISGQDFKGNTALHMATFNGRADMVEVLLNAGAKVNKLNIDGNTPLHIACQSCTQGKLMLILKLLQAGADTLLKNKSGCTPLDTCGMFNKIDAASALLDHNQKLVDNTLAIVEASIRGSTNMVQLLLDYGVNPNHKDLKHGTRPLHEAVRYIRYETAKVLLSYGANPMLKNDKGETVETIALLNPQDKAEKFLSLIKEFNNIPKCSPRFLKGKSQPPDLLQGQEVMTASRYPLLKTNREWTANSAEYCNSCTSSNPNTHLVDGNPCSFWVIPSSQHAWTVLDLQHRHTLTGIRVLGWSSSQMVKNFEIQKASQLIGPWETVNTYQCKMLGSKDPKQPGIPQDFFGFCSTSRYWRFLIVDNYGGNCICVQGVQFYGFDCRVQEFFMGLNFHQYIDLFITQGYNSYESLVEFRVSELEQMIPNTDDRKAITNALHDIKLQVYPLSQLSWIREPVANGKEGDMLPGIAVQSDPGVTEELEILFHAEGKVETLSRTHILPNGPTEASIAMFEGVTINKAGKYNIEVRSSRFPDVRLCCPHTIQIAPKVKDATEIAAAFDELEDMLRAMQASLEPEPEPRTETGNIGSRSRGNSGIASGTSTNSAKVVSNNAPNNYKF